MNFKYLGKKADVESAKQYILGVDIVSTNYTSTQNLICSACKGVIKASVYDLTLPGFEFEIPSECPLCGVQIRKAVSV